MQGLSFKFINDFTRMKTYQIISKDYLSMRVEFICDKKY